jgi:sec-independent protein translocase protein TatA
MRFAIAEGESSRLNRHMGLDNPLHIAFLVVILLLLFGARRLPEIGRSLGSGMREFKQSITGESHSQQPALPAGQQPQQPQQVQQAAPAPAPVAQPGAAQAPVATPAQAPVAAPVQGPVAAPAEPAAQPASSPAGTGEGEQRD